MVRRRVGGAVYSYTVSKYPTPHINPVPAHMPAHLLFWLFVFQVGNLPRVRRGAAGLRTTGTGGVVTVVESKIELSRQRESRGISAQ